MMGFQLPEPPLRKQKEMWISVKESSWDGWVLPAREYQLLLSLCTILLYPSEDGGMINTRTAINMERMGNSLRSAVKDHSAGIFSIFPVVIPGFPKLAVVRSQSLLALDETCPP